MAPPQRSKPNSAPPGQPAAGPSGRVRHDERGNAVWDWLKDTGRSAIDATSRLLKKLELSHLEVEDKDESCASSPIATRAAGTTPTISPPSRARLRRAKAASGL